MTKILIVEDNEMNMRLLNAGNLRAGGDGVDKGDTRNCSNQNYCRDGFRHEGG